jgi:hypothetical protein
MQPGGDLYQLTQQRDLDGMIEAGARADAPCSGIQTSWRGGWAWRGQLSLLQLPSAVPRRESKLEPGRTHRAEDPDQLARRLDLERPAQPSAAAVRSPA